MKRFLCLIFCLCLLFSLSACNEESEQKDRTEVVINLPEDNSVNGYRTESNESFDDTVIDANSVVVDTETGKTTSSSSNSEGKYCANINSKVFHNSNCPSVSKMKEENKKFFNDRDEVISQGYKSCGSCKP